MPSKNTFVIPKVKRNCCMLPDRPCAFSYEHTKNLAINGCDHAGDPQEYFTPVCQNCVKIAGQFSQIRQISASLEQVPTVDTTQHNSHDVS